MNERALVAECLSGDRGAWDCFVRIYHPFVLAAVEQAFPRGSEADVEDLCQEVFVSLFQEGGRRLREFQWRCSLKNWLRVVAASRVVDHHRKARAHLCLDEERFSAGSLTDGSTPERVRHSLLALGARDRLLLRLAHHRQRSYRQIAELLGVEENSIGPALNRAEQRFKENLARLTC